MSDINEIKRLIAESEGLELSNWNTATHAQREAWASIETQGRAWIIDFITTIESQKEEIEKLLEEKSEWETTANHGWHAAGEETIKVESLKAITELAVNTIHDALSIASGQNQNLLLEPWDGLREAISEIERLQNE